MFPIRVAVATHCFKQRPKQALRTARDIGADGVQFDARRELKPSEFSETGRRQLLHLMDELGLSVASLALPTRRSLYETEELDARLEAFRETMQFAFQLKSKVVVARIGRVPAESDSAQYRLLGELLNDLARFANRVGVTLAVTPTGESGAALAALLKTVTEGPIGINFDPSVFVISGQDPGSAFREMHQFVAHVQVRDAIRDIDGGGLEVPVGRGEVDWDELLALCDEARYGGWFTVERTQGDDKIGDMGRAVQFLRRVISG